MKRKAVKGMKKYRMRKSILTIGILMVLCSIVPLLLFSVIVNQNMLRTLQANMTINYQKTIDELALSLSMNIQPFIDLLQYDTRRADVVKLFSDVSNGKKEFQAKELQQKLQDRETAVRVGYPYSYLAVTANGMACTGHSVTEASEWSQTREPWFQTVTETHSHVITIGTGEKMNGIGHNDRLYFAGSVLNGTENCGVLMYSVNIAFLEKLLEQARYGESGSLFILDESNVCIAAAENENSSIGHEALAEALTKQMDQTLDIGGKEYMLTQSAMSLFYVDARWRVVSVVPSYELLQEKTRVQIIAISLTMFLVIAIMVVLQYLNIRYIRPFQRLYGAMREVRHGDLTVQIRAQRNDEIGELLDGFDSMVRSMDRNVRRIHEEEEEKRTMELRALQEQINPHFISNTLNTIRVMADMRHAEGISTALQSFVRLIEYSFRDMDSLSTLGKELEHLEEYVFLQNLRYQNCFSLVNEIAPELAPCQIPKLTLQPLVENCVQHAFPERWRLGEIRITAQTLGGDLCVSVHDNGAGISPQIMEECFSEQALLRMDGAHKGVANVHKRIRLQFGPQYGLTAESTPGSGTTVSIRIPMLKKETEGADA